MLKDFLSHSQSLEFKDLGYHEVSLGYYGKHHDYQEVKFYLGACLKNSEPGLVQEAVDAPTYSAAFRWFRQNYNLHCEIACGKGQFFFRIGEIDGFPHIIDDNNRRYYNNYEEAQTAAIDKLIKIVKELKTKKNDQ